eukprot:PhM_4_TR7819/c0_g1_i1/m.14804
MGGDNHDVFAIDRGIRGLTKEEQNALQPTDALLRLLKQAQVDHRQCLRDANKSGKDPVDLCALTWGNVHHSYRQWAAYRAPFKDYEAVQKWSKLHGASA